MNLASPKSEILMMAESSFDPYSRFSGYTPMSTDYNTYLEISVDDVQTVTIPNCIYDWFDCV
jgi:hypothetical protein